MLMRWCDSAGRWINARDVRGVDRVVGDQMRKKQRREERRGERGDVARMMTNARTNSPRLLLLSKNLINSVIRQPIRILIPRLRRNLVLHTSIFQNVRPLPTSTSMGMLQMLTEMIRTEEFLRIIALAKLMNGGEVVESRIPVWTREVREFLAAIAACVV